ncbi:MAG TPA: S26 family signal peptidase [Candidatus Limnocylindria bacterium]|nr:S26 family signal peptidase [Candidatus Limnocylindria bacterium]
MRSRGLIGPLLLLGGLLAARRWLDTVKVRGRSMAPTLLSGDRLLVARLGPRVGDVVLAADPRDGQRELVKRAVSIDAFGVTLRGDNPVASTDARTFGAIPAERVRWRVLLRYWPLERAGLVPAAPPVVDEGGEDACTFPQALIAGE